MFFAFRKNAFSKHSDGRTDICDNRTLGTPETSLS
jgi:hypothetical protein